MESEPERKVTPQVQESMEVVSSDGILIGYVTKVRKKDFRVHRLVAPDTFLPYTAIDSISEGTIKLTLSDHEIALARWSGSGSVSAVPHPHRKEGE